MTKNQKLLALSTIVVAVAILLMSCGTAVSTEVKTDSTEMKQDTVKIDTLK